MSKMKKKTNKPMRLSVLAASLMMLAPITHSANTSFSDKPLVGVSENFAPHIVLALSVEFPTAGAAYMDSTEFSFANGDHTKSYRGYFDNQKCYIYQNGAFVPSSKASVSSFGGKTTVGECNNNRNDEFSGNLLNFMTMSALDIFRSTMTGGNRAQGTEATSTTYTQADQPNQTFLRRAKVVQGQNAGTSHKLRERTIRIGANLAEARKYLPHKYVVENTKSPSELGLVVDDQPLPSGGTTNTAYGFYSGYSGSQTMVSRTVNQPVGTKDEFVSPHSGNDLMFYNENFGFTIMAGRYQLWMNESNNAGSRIGSWDREEYREKFGPNTKGQLGTANDGLATFTSTNDTSATARKSYIAIDKRSYRRAEDKFNVVVKVCDASVGLEENCKQYGSNYKPEGLVQRYTLEKDMRFATLGYLNINGDEVHGGVLRSRMKNLLNDNGDTGTYGKEWDSKTGVFDLNPDKTDARQSNVSNSGTINYLNKFGDASGYKGNDPGAELYYTALAYLRGTNEGNAPYQVSQSSLTATAKDGFPVIYNWDDPMTRGIEKKNWQCHKNMIIFIGDTNTHNDRDLPNFSTRNSYQPKVQFNGTGPKAAAEDDKNKETDVKTMEYLEQIYRGENYSTAWNWERGLGANSTSGTSPGGIAGLAYWARVNDIRNDIKGTQNGNNFIIDVAENNELKSKLGGALSNAYYLAAKYGGFTRTDTSKDEDKNATAREKDSPVSTWSPKLTYNVGNAIRKPNELIVDKRSTWTDDPLGQSTIPEFKLAPDGGGTPRNYAVANNPDAMVAALEKAMQAGGDMNNPTQAATGLSVNTGEALDFTGGKKPITLQSTYNFAELSGDVIAYETEYAPNPDEGTLLKTTRKWGAAEKLNTTYRNGAHFARKLYTIRGGQIYDFNANNASNIFAGLSIEGTPQNLANYILGSTEYEGVTYRVRKSLMGTVINSAVMPIVKVTKAPANCTYTNDNAVRTRPTYYAAAANDGILHVMNDQGSPVFGYMAGTAIDKLNEFAKRDYAHQYLNDGTPVIAEVCMAKSSTENPTAGNGQAKTVLLGTTGRGGASVYALDVTNLSSVSKDVVMWEFSNKDNPDLGLTVSTPVITSAPDGRPLAIVSSGYNNQSGKGSIFILDISKDKGTSWQKGTNYWQIELDGSGVGNPFVYDQDNDGVGDKIFVGDLDGKLWQIDRTTTVGSGDWTVAYGDNPLFTPEAGNERPITGAPYADTVAGKLMVVVGTGKYFATTDLSATQQNYAYGFVVGSQAITEADLLQQQITQTPATGDNIKLNPDQVSVYTISENTMQPHHKGWRLELLPGQNIAADSLIRQKQAAEFTAARVTDESTAQCARDASTSYISVDAATGGLNRRPVFDTDGDGKIDANDARVGVYEMKGVATSQSRLITIKTDGGTFNVLRATSGDKTGDARINNFNAAKGVRRISWREIF